MGCFSFRLGRGDYFGLRRLQGWLSKGLSASALAFMVRGVGEVRIVIVLSRAPPF